MTASLQALTGASEAAKYYCSYLEAGETTGVWFGLGAELLGLHQGRKVNRREFLHVLDGRTPDGKKMLVQHQRRKTPSVAKVMEKVKVKGKVKGKVRKVDRSNGRRPGYDVTFSARKLP